VPAEFTLSGGARNVFGARVVEDVHVVIVGNVVIVGKCIVCRNCALESCAAFDSPTGAFAHMLVHTKHGHRVRRGMLEGLAVASALHSGAP
jgi:hypothetical protein